MNPDTNELERLRRSPILKDGGVPVLVRKDGSVVPRHWAIFAVGEEIVVKGYTFRVAYLNEGAIMLEPIGPAVVGDDVEARVNELVAKIDDFDSKK